MRVLDKCTETLRLGEVGNYIRVLPLMIFVARALKLKFVIALCIPMNSY